MSVRESRVAVAVLVLCSGSAAAADRCETLCTAWDRATDKADVTFDGSTGRLASGTAELPSAQSVKVAVTDLNPFRFEYRLEVTAQPASARLAQDVFGKYLAAVGGGAPGAAPKALVRPEGRRLDPKTCTPDQQTALAAIATARDTETTALALPERFMTDADAFLTETSAEVLPRATCASLCRKAELLVARRSEWSTDPGAAERDLGAKLDAAKAQVASVVAQPDPASCLTTVKEELAEVEGHAPGWPERFARVKEVYPQLDRLDTITRAALARDDAFALSRVQNTPGPDAVVRVNLYRRDVRQPGSAESVVTSSELRVGRGPISLSLGIGAMGLTNRTPIRQSAPATGGTVGSVFAYDTKSIFDPAVVVLLNARLVAGQIKHIGQCSFGVSTGIQPAGTAERLRYLAGVSFGALDELILLTLGAAIGEVAYIDGGFGAGDPVPDGVQEIPTRHDWEVGWFAAIAYRIR
jgi:hypothetical protein